MTAMKRIINILTLCILLHSACGCRYILDQTAEIPEDYGTSISCKLDGRLAYRRESLNLDFREILGDCYVTESSFYIQLGCPLAYNTSDMTCRMKIAATADKEFELNVKYDVSSVSEYMEMDSFATFSIDPVLYTAESGWIMFDSMELSSDGTSCIVSGSFSFEAVGDSEPAKNLKVRNGSFTGVLLNYFDDSVMVGPDKK